MVPTATPPPPTSLPNYLAGGLKKQDAETLRDVQIYVKELLEDLEREIPSAELPESSEPVADVDEGRGTLVRERVKCGDESCHCMSGGEKHGPYLYRYFREAGRLKSEYVGKPSVAD